jgi:hypothetical protein
MPRGTTFLGLVTDLRNALGRSTDVAVGVADLPRLKYTINRAYHQVYARCDWPHLRTEFAKIPFVAGQRYYDYPAGLNFDRIESTTVWWGNRPRCIERGISFAQFDSYDSLADERSSSVERWDVRLVDTVEQIEVWPIPSDNTQSLQFIGQRKVADLVADIDVCLLDDDLVVSKAASRLAKDKDDKQLFIAEFESLLSDIKANAANSLPPIRIGGGARRDEYRPVVVRVR